MKYMPTAKPLMLMTKTSHTCLIVSSMASLVLLMMVLYGTMSSQQPGGSSLRHDYQLLGRPLYKLDLSWPKNPELYTGDVFGVAVNQYAGVVYVAQRDTLDKLPGRRKRGRPQRRFMGERAECQHDRGRCIKRYTPSGKLLQVLGTPGKAGSGLDPLQFDQPAEIFIHDSGEIYIVDGDGGMNNRLIKLSKEQKVMWMHGEKGQGLAQFYIPHSVTVDTAQRVWVADRGNKRIQVFNSVTGEWLGTWGSCFTEDAPYSVRLTPDKKYFVVVQLNTNQISLLDAPPVGMIGQCRVVSVIQLADDVKPHLVDLDLKTGALYVAEIGAQQAQKFTPFSLGENFL